jgi:thiol:disulfide interchange protein DsbA
VAIHDSRELGVNDQSALVAWMARQGVERDKFTEVYGSFGVDNAVSRANQRAMAYRIDGVPTFVVDGKYLTSVSMTGDGQNLIATLNYLIARARHGKR